MSGREFNISRIEFDDGDGQFGEAVAEVTASATRAALELIREVIGEVRSELTGEPEHVAVFLPVDDMMRLYRGIGPGTVGTDPAYEQAHAIWESLNWVYCSLIDGE